MRELDKNQDGEISAEERAAMRRQRSAELIETIDADGDGSVSKDEVERSDNPRALRVLRDFDAVDGDGDSLVTLEELEAALEERRRAGPRPIVPRRRMRGPMLPKPGR